MFPDRKQSFNGLKHLTEKATAVASLTRVRVVHGRPHNAHPTALHYIKSYLDSRRQIQSAKIDKVKDIALVLWSVSLPNQDFIFCHKTSWPSVFIRHSLVRAKGEVFVLLYVFLFGQRFLDNPRADSRQSLHAGVLWFRMCLCVDGSTPNFIFVGTLSADVPPPPGGPSAPGGGGGELKTPKIGG